MVHAASQQEFSDADFRVVDNSDQSKKVALDVSGVTAATTRTLTVPDANGTLMLTSAVGTTVQAWDADLDDLALRWAAASASGPATLDIREDTDNGTNRVRVTVPASLASDFTFTLPAADVTVSAFGGSLIDDANAAAALTTLGVSSFIQGALDETSLATFLASIGLRLNLGTIADDAVASVAIAGAGTYVGFVSCALNNTASMFLFRSNSAAAPFGMAVTGSGTTIDYSVSVLTGTTGTDGRITVGNPGTGTVYVENRRGNSMGTTSLHLLGPV